MQKKFSIIIPSYNCEKYIEITLESIIKQKSNLYECIIVDGMSKDNTINIIKEYCSLYNNIRFISEKDNGIYDAMNKGITLAEGEYLYFIGAGDTLVDKCLENMDKELSKQNSDFIYGNIICKTAGNVKVGYEFSKNEMAIQGICHQAIFYRKEIFEKIGVYNLKYKVFADNVLNIQVIGDNSITKRYCDVDVAYYMGNGVSQNIRDIPYYKDIKNIIYNNLGKSALDSYFNSGRYYFDVLLNEDKNNICFIGDEYNYKKFCEDINLYKQNNGMQCVDNYKSYILNNNSLDLNEIQESLFYIIGMKKSELREEVIEFCKKKGICIELPYFRKSNELLEFISKNKNNLVNIVLFGASKLSERFIDYLENENINNINIKCIIDNNLSKQHQKFTNNYVIENPDKILNEFNENVFIASTWNYDIEKQLKNYNVKNIIRIHLA